MEVVLEFLGGGCADDFLDTLPVHLEVLDELLLVVRVGLEHLLDATEEEVTLFEFGLEVVNDLEVIIFFVPNTILAMLIDFAFLNVLFTDNTKYITKLAYHVFEIEDIGVFLVSVLLHQILMLTYLMG